MKQFPESDIHKRSIDNIDSIDETADISKPANEIDTAQGNNNAQSDNVCSHTAPDNNLLTQTQNGGCTAKIKEYEECAAELLRRSKSIGIRYALKSIAKYGAAAVFANIKGIKRIRESGDFNILMYCSKYKDVLESGMDPLVHYIWYGGYEGKNPSDEFDSEYYCKINTDVKRSKINPLVHYVLYGRDEGRVCRKEKRTISSSDVIFSYVSDITAAPVRTKEKFVSVIMPTWNRKDIIDNAIESVLSQTYQNFCLIIVDDGSTDDTKEHINSKYSAQISSGKIKYIYRENSGVSAARNTGLEASDGEYIAYLDSDNRWHKNYLEKMVSAFTSNPQIRSAYCGLRCLNSSNKPVRIRNEDFEREQLLNQNFIDLNVFMHRRSLYSQYGGFDTNLKRLVDWELIIRYTRMTPAYHVNKVLADYYENNTENRITQNIDLGPNIDRVLKKHRREMAALGSADLNIAYILWDYPAGSQTFVFNEIKYLIANGMNVQVFYKVTAENAVKPDFEIKATMVRDHHELAAKLIENDIDYMHAHFAYPTAYQLAYEASKLTGIPYSFAAHAVDIFHHSNDNRNHVGEVGRYSRCEKILVPGGNFHLYFLRERGVPAHKIAVTNQAVSNDFLNYCSEQKGKFKSFDRDKIKIVAIGRFIEKKGFEYLIRAAAYLDNKFSIEIYGYGELQSDYEALIKEYDSKHIVKLCGSVSNAMQCLRDADILAAPCVVAENGDIDGMPTVVLEAMAAGVIVVSTDVSSIPYVVKDGYNGFTVHERDEKALAQKLIEVSSMSAEEKNLIVQNGYNTVGSNDSSHTMASVLLKNILQESVSIFLVTYCSESFDETRHIIDNLYEKTVTDFDLIIVDNNSPNREFIEYLQELEQTHKNVNIILSKKNLYCGPASNLALSTVNTEFAIYICSNEGYPIDYGWESKFIDYMRQNPNTAIAGAPSYSPKMCTRKAYRESEVFNKFRNQDFISNIPEPIRFVQGGIYILRMSAFHNAGGFSEQLPQQHTDVEYSYFLRSKGYDIGFIDNVYCGTKTTLPKPSDFVNDRTLAVHPYSFEKLSAIQKVITDNLNICSICGFTGNFSDGICPDCSSTPSDRCLYEYIAENEICCCEDFPADTSGYKTQCSEFRSILDKCFGFHGKKIIITNQLSSCIADGERVIFVTDDISVSPSAIDAEKYSREIKQLYSRSGAYSNCKIIIYKKRAD